MKMLLNITVFLLSFSVLTDLYSAETMLRTNISEKNTSKSKSKRKAAPGDGVIKPKGDDLFPWPWGAECVFPWANIEGSYVVKAVSPGQFDGHYIVLEVAGKNESSQNSLIITQFDSWGRLYARGRGFNQKNSRLVDGALTPINHGPKYVVIIRSYPEVVSASCTKRNQITAITFCPTLEPKCMETSNYILEKLK
ncbi:MAG: hypothetical protein ABL927_04680 [Bdellovibrionales bacterium]